MTMSVMLDVQRAANAPDLPRGGELQRWVEAALSTVGADRPGGLELTIRFVDADEGAELNLRYRGRDAPTNVLAFPFEAPPGTGEWPLIGDLVLCVPVVVREAAEQHKEASAHWAHLIVHGVLHLLGHDHLEPAEAEAMEALETAILDRLGFPPPYEAETHVDDERSN